MKVYRNISPVELLTLLDNGVVDGRFDKENNDSDYKVEYGPVVCCFVQPIKIIGPHGYDFLIEIEVPEEEVVASGKMRWNYKDGYDLVFCEVDEVYIRKYSFDQVKWIRSLNHEPWLTSADCLWAVDSVLSFQVQNRWLKGVNIFGEEQRVDWWPSKPEDYLHYLDRLTDEQIEYLLKDKHKQAKAIIWLLRRHLDFLKSIPPTEPWEFPSACGGDFEVERWETDIYY